MRRVLVFGIGEHVYWIVFGTTRRFFRGCGYAKSYKCQSVEMAELSTLAGLYVDRDADRICTPIFC